MASSGLQIVGFLLALLGLSAIISATFMVEWTEISHGTLQKVPTYKGLWMECTGQETTTCEVHDSIFKLDVTIQATRAVMLTSILLSAVGILVCTLGMKCTRFMEEKIETKAKAALTGGIFFFIAGLLSLIITSWYVRQIFDTNATVHHLQSLEFGKAVIVSWAGSLLNIVGGMCLCYRRCSRNPEPLMHNHQLATNPKSNYV